MTIDKDIKLGRVVLTQGVNYDLQHGKLSTTFILDILERHRSGNWGELCEENWQHNEEAVEHGYRILSSYFSSAGKIYIITEHDRSATTILYPDEY